MLERMQKGPVLSAESYPDECWVFDNVAALDAVRMAELSGRCRSFRIHTPMAGDGKKEAHRSQQPAFWISSFTVNGEHWTGRRAVQYG